MLLQQHEVVTAHPSGVAGASLRGLLLLAVAQVPREPLDGDEQRDQAHATSLARSLRFIPHAAGAAAAAVAFF